MANQRGETCVMLPQQIMEAYVLPAQRRIYEETGELLTNGLVVRRLVAKGFAADMAECTCQLSAAD